MSDVAHATFVLMKILDVQKSLISDHMALYCIRLTSSVVHIYMHALETFFGSLYGLIIFPFEIKSILTFVY